MNQVIERAQALERKAKDKFKQQREQKKEQWIQTKAAYPEETGIIAVINSVTGKPKAMAIKDPALVFKAGKFDPVKPGVLDPKNFKEAEYDWYAHCRRVNEKA